MPSGQPSLWRIALTATTGTTAAGHSSVQRTSSGSFAIFTPIRRASSFVSSFGGRSPAEIDICERLAATVADHKASGLLFDGPGRREAALCHDDLSH